MEISYSYRGVNTILNTEFCSPIIDVKGNVNFHSVFSPNRKQFRVVLQPHELLPTAYKCLEQLNRIAGTNYKIFNQPK